jgi:thiol-disulfide isomerase/thioredoxin
VIDLWATWCTGCEQAHQSLERLVRESDSHDLYVVGVNIGQSHAEIERYIAAHPYGYPVLLDPAFKLAEALNIEEIPTMFVLDRTGKLLHTSARLDTATLRIIRDAQSVSASTQSQAIAR